MLWFKHFTDSLDDPFIQELLEKFGAKGYLAYFGLIEIVARENGRVLTGKLSINPSYLRRKLRISITVLKQMYKFCDTNAKLSVNFSEKLWHFSIPKLLELKDNYTKDLQASCKKLSEHKEEDKDNTYSKNKNGNGKKPPVKVETNGKAKDVIAKFCSLYKGRYGVTYTISGKDAGIAQRVCNHEDVGELLDLYFSSTDKFILDGCHAFNIFESQINKLRVQKVVKPTNQPGMFEEFERHENN